MTKKDKGVGVVVQLPKGNATIHSRLMTESTGGKNPSTFYEGKLEDGSVVVIHENIVKAVLDGTYEMEKPKVKGPRKQRTKKERAVDHVKNMLRQRMSRGAIIKELASKLRISRSTAQTYYYQVKG